MAGARVNRFADLANAQNNENRSYLESSTSPVADSASKLEEAEQKAKKKPAKQETGKKDVHVEVSASSLSKFGKKDKEIKSIRKQFLITPSNDQWLKETAEATGISVNELINQMIEAEREA